MELITNRTQADVDRVKELKAIGYDNMTDSEKAEWDNGLNGAYNSSDLNRVELAVKYLNERVMGGRLVVKTNWDKGEIPTAAEMNRFLNNVKQFKTDFAVDIYLPDSMSKLNYITANNIEKCILIVEDFIKRYYYTNDVYSGEVNL